MSAASTSLDTKNPSTQNETGDHFSRTGGFQALAVADQLRKKTELKKNEQLRKYTFEIPIPDSRESNIPQADEFYISSIKNVEHELLFTEISAMSLGTLSRSFRLLQRTFNQMLDLNNDIQQIILATAITRIALLIGLRSIELMAETVTKEKGARKFPTFTSLVSYVRSRPNELPVHGQLLVKWYDAAQVLDLLVRDSDWLVTPHKAYWAMQICNETLAWGYLILSEKHHVNLVGRPIYDRENSICGPESIEK